MISSWPKKKTKMDMPAKGPTSPGVANISSWTKLFITEPILQVYNITRFPKRRKMMHFCRTVEQYFLMSLKKYLPGLRLTSTFPFTCHFLIPLLTEEMATWKHVATIFFFCVAIIAIFSCCWSLKSICKALITWMLMWTSPLTNC